MSVTERVREIRERMAAACARRGRAEHSVRLMAVTKTLPAERIREAWDCGLRLFGENRVQERLAKREALQDLAAEWHLIGPLQSNKAGKAVENFQTIQTVDSLELAARLDRLAKESGRQLAAMLEINIGREGQKHGVLPEQARALAQAVAGLSALQLRGVMTVPPMGDTAEMARPYFAELAKLGEEVRSEAGMSADGWDLSMGMSHDYEVAIEEGATLVRLGTAIFGERAP